MGTARPLSLREWRREQGAAPCTVQCSALVLTLDPSYRGVSLETNGGHGGRAANSRRLRNRRAAVTPAWDPGGGLVWGRSVWCGESEGTRGTVHCPSYMPDGGRRLAMMIRMETMTINSRPWRRGSRAASPTSKRPEAVVVEWRGGRDREIRGCVCTLRIGRAAQPETGMVAMAWHAETADGGARQMADGRRRRVANTRTRRESKPASSPEATPEARTKPIMAPSQAGGQIRLRGAAMRRDAMRGKVRQGKGRRPRSQAKAGTPPSPWAWGRAGGRKVHSTGSNHQIAGGNKSWRHAIGSLTSRRARSTEYIGAVPVRTPAGAAGPTLPRLPRWEACCARLRCYRVKDGFLWGNTDQLIG